MPFLRVGEVVVAVTDAVAERWPALEAAAIAAAAARPHGRPSIWFRTDAGSVGIMSITSNPATEDQGPATGAGIITEASVTHNELSTPADPPRERTDDEIAELVRELKAKRPHTD